MDHARKQEIERLNVEAKRGDKKAQQQVRQLERPPAQEPTQKAAQTKAERKAQQQPQGEPVGSPARQQSKGRQNRNRSRRRRQAGRFRIRRKRQRQKAKSKESRKTGCPYLPRNMYLIHAIERAFEESPALGFASALAHFHKASSLPVLVDRLGFGLISHSVHQRNY